MSSQANKIIGGIIGLAVLAGCAGPNVASYIPFSGTNSLSANRVSVERHAKPAPAPSPGDIVIGRPGLPGNVIIGRPGLPGPIPQ